MPCQFLRMMIPTHANSHPHTHIQHYPHASSPGRHLTLAILSLTAALPAGARAAGAPPARAGEIQVSGVLSRVDRGADRLEMLVNLVTMPDGKNVELTTPRPKTVVITSHTLMHVRGDVEQLVRVSDLRQGMHAIATGKDLGPGRELPARDLAVWDIMQDGSHTLQPRGYGGAGTGDRNNLHMDTPALTLPATARMIWSVAYASDGKTVAAGGSVIQGRSLTLKTSVNNVGDVKSAAVDQAGGLDVWDARTGALLFPLAPGISVFAIAYSPDGQVLAAGCGDGFIRLYNVDTGQTTRTLGQAGQPVYTLAFSPDGHSLASSTGDESVQIWDTRGGTLLRAITSPVKISGAVVFSPNGKILATGNEDNTIGLWDPGTSQQLGSLSTGRAPAPKITFSPDGKYIAAGGRDGLVTVWDVETMKPLHTLTGHTGKITAVSFSANGKLIATGGSDRTVKIWNVDDGTMLKSIDAAYGSVNSVAFSPDGKSLVSSSSEPLVRVWNP